MKVLLLLVSTLHAVFSRVAIGTAERCGVTTSLLIEPPLAHAHAEENLDDDSAALLQTRSRVTTIVMRASKSDTLNMLVDNAGHVENITHWLPIAPDIATSANASASNAGNTSSIPPSVSRNISGSASVFSELLTFEAVTMGTTDKHIVGNASIASSVLPAVADVRTSTLRSNRSAASIAQPAGVTLIASGFSSSVTRNVSSSAPVAAESADSAIDDASGSNISSVARAQALGRGANTASLEVFKQLQHSPLQPLLFILQEGLQGATPGALFGALPGARVGALLGAFLLGAVGALFGALPGALMGIVLGAQLGAVLGTFLLYSFLGVLLFALVFTVLCGLFASRLDEFGRRGGSRRFNSRHSQT